MLLVNLLYNKRLAMFEVIGSHDKRYSVQLHRTFYDLGDHVIALRYSADGTVTSEAVEGTDAWDEAFLYFAS